MIITSTYQGRAKQENIFLIRYETNGEEKKLLKKAKTKEDATRQTNLPFPWTLIECALAYVVKVQRPIMASGADTLLIYSEDGRILPSLLPTDSQIGKALGNRKAGSFVCTIQNDELCVHTEIK